MFAKLKTFFCGYRDIIFKSKCCEKNKSVMDVNLSIINKNTETEIKCFKCFYHNKIS